MPDEEKIDLSVFLNEYLSDAKSGFQKAGDALLAFEKDRGHTEKLDEIGRAFHTLKASSAMLGFNDIVGLAHSAEDLIGGMKDANAPAAREIVDILFEVTDTLERMVAERGKKTASDWEGRVSELKEKIRTTAEGGGPKPAARPAPSGGPQPFEKIETVRVHMRLLDDLFNQIGELLIAKNRLYTILRGIEGKDLREVMATIGRTVNAMQENVMAARLVPVNEIFQKFPRMVRDLAREEQKEIDLIMDGRDIEFDKSMLDAINEPIIHLLRNAVGHGIEPAAERDARGKGKRGTINLVARRAENHILIDVEDDGRGIDLDRMKEVAVRKGFVTPEEAGLMSGTDVMKILFAPGFSSAEDVTGLSGRGIGLSVVKAAARELGGTVDVSTDKGKGTKFSMTLPLTTAIVQTLLVEVGGHVFAIPSELVLETVRLAASDVKETAGRPVFVKGNDVLPLVHLHDVFRIEGTARRQRGEHNVVVIRREKHFIGLVVDEVVGQMDNIIKPFDPIAQKFKGFSGGTIMGDGRVALFLDIPALLGFEALIEEKYSI